MAKKTGKKTAAETTAKKPAASEGRSFSTTSTEVLARISELLGTLQATIGVLAKVIEQEIAGTGGGKSSPAPKGKGKGKAKEVEEDEAEDDEDSDDDGEDESEDAEDEAEDDEESDDEEETEDEEDETEEDDEALLNAAEQKKLRKALNDYSDIHNKNKAAAILMKFGKSSKHVKRKDLEKLLKKLKV